MSELATYKILWVIYQLDPRHVFLPPYIFPVLWTHRSNQVISVHNNMNRRVEKSNQKSLLTRKKFQIAPWEKSCYSVVIDMKKCHLILLLPQNEKNLEHGGNTVCEKCWIYTGKLLKIFEKCSAISKIIYYYI